MMTMAAAMMMMVMVVAAAIILLILKILKLRNPLNTLLNSHVRLMPHVETYQKAKSNHKRESFFKGFPSFSKRGMGNMVPKELLGNEEEGKGIPFWGVSEKGNGGRECRA